MNVQLRFRKNAQVNGVQNVRIFVSDGLSMVDKDVEAAAILTNPPIRAGRKRFSAFTMELTIG